MWGGLALASVGLGAGLGQLAVRRGAAESVADVVVPAETALDPSAIDARVGADTPRPVPPSPASADNGSEPATPLMNAVVLGDNNRVKKLLDAGASVNEKHARGRTLLMEAVANGHRSLALTLVVLGADLAEQNRAGMTVMMVAVEQRDHVFLRRLRELSRLARIQDPLERQAELRAFSGVERS